MSTHPCNPRYFPRMKVRGKDRRRQAYMQRVHGAFDRLGLAALRASGIIENIVSDLYKGIH